MLRTKNQRMLTKKEKKVDKLLQDGCVCHTQQSTNKVKRLQRAMPVPLDIQSIGRTCAWLTRCNCITHKLLFRGNKFNMTDGRVH